MLRRPPHVLVTTPESLYLLLTSAAGRRILSTVRTAVADLDAMQRIELAPPLPDLTRALTLLEQRGGS